MVQKLYKIRLSIISTKSKEQIEQECRNALQLQNSVLSSLKIREIKLPQQKRYV